MFSVFSTPWHTGTTYFINGLPKGTHQRHINQSSYNDALKADIVYTTYRDPYHMAASWFNRDLQKIEEAWRDQWLWYGRLLKLDPIIFDITKGRYQHGFTFGEEPLNSKGDTYGLHAMVNNGDFESFFKAVPKQMIDYAINNTFHMEPRDERL